MKKIQLTQEFIADMYRACTKSQLAILSKHVDFADQTISEDGFKQLYKAACDKWQAIFNESFPEVFKETGFVFGEFEFDEVNNQLEELLAKCGVRMGAIQILHGAASTEEYQDKGLYISNDYDLEINNCRTGAFEIILRHGSGKLSTSCEITVHGDSK